jgi:UDP-N-acetylmuramyl pentapeptide phosphotransferase/UDP-N-acetylglucosamine-1-phosphate transferase
MNLYDLMLIVPAVLTAYVISYISMPAIIRIAELKEFIDSPDGGRKLHQRFVPTMGGVGIFAAFIISYSIWGQVVSLGSFPFFIAALLILFLMGVRDDIVELTPFKKFVIQFVAASILVIGGGVSLGSFSGLLGIGELNLVQGAIASIVILVAIVNAYNLIDGIDGLAGGVGVIASGILGIWFWGAGFLSYAILSFSLSGALIGFLAFNMFPARIFMGDTGAMSIGFILGYLSLEFLILNHGLTAQPWHITNGEVLAISILIIPIVDTLRVIGIRLKKGVSPFKADRSHIHHEILNLGISHLHSAFILWLINIFMIGVAYVTMPLNINIQLIVLISVGLAFLPMIKLTYKFGERLFSSENAKDTQDSRTTAYDIK